MGVLFAAIAGRCALLADGRAGGCHVEVGHEVLLLAAKLATAEVDHVFAGVTREVLGHLLAEALALLGGLGEGRGGKRGLDASPGEAGVLVHRGLLVGAGHEVLRHEGALLGGLVALAIRGLALSAVDRALLHLHILLVGSLGLLLLRLGVLSAALLGTLLLALRVLSLRLLHGSLTHLSLEATLGSGGTLREFLGGAGTLGLECTSRGLLLLLEVGVSLLLGPLLPGVTMVDQGGQMNC